MRLRLYRKKLAAIALLLLGLHGLVGLQGRSQERNVDPTWLHRHLSQLNVAIVDLTSPTCRYKPIFGEGDPEAKILHSVKRFGELTLDPHGSCQPALYERQEEIYLVLEGDALLQYADQALTLHSNDFTYLSPGAKHSLANHSERPLRLLLMTFAIPRSTAIKPPPRQPQIISLDKLKEETVEGHPTSVLYKLMVGPHTATRDAIDQAYVVTSLFWMDFAPGGTNFPHHHETAEEIYLLVDGQGDMVAGSGMDGIEARFPAKPGDAYYFRPNCTVGFYNQNSPGAKAHILAVRSRIPLSQEED